MITSVQNPKIQWVRKLQSQARQRREEGVFVVEGVRLVEEALAAGWQARLVLQNAAGVLAARRTQPDRPRAGPSGPAFFLMFDFRGCPKQDGW